MEAALKERRMHLQASKPELFSSPVKSGHRQLAFAPIFQLTIIPFSRDLSILDAVACRKMHAMHTYTVALRIQSRDLDSAQITRELGLTPTQTRAVGGHRSADKVW